MIAEHVGNIRRRIERACERSGRTPSDVTVVAVAKTFPATVIREAVDAGVPDIGENYVQELLPKRESLADESIRWHFIGHLQSNKVKYIAPWVHLIHTVDSPALAQEIHRRAAASGRTIDVLIEVNTTGEQSKFGVPPPDTDAFVASLAPFSSIRVCGLMTMGLFLPDPESSRPLFRQLRQLKETLSERQQQNLHMHHLSMGMSGDFEVAIEEGATLVRIGTGIFGSRTRKKQE
jgi:hypothetical protein